ncbi:MAG: ABC transporter permease [Prevotella sp.]|nr:ABC transporter permease [Prevotella sp.]
MGLPLFIASRIYGKDGSEQNVSRPAITIATLGVAIGLAVMIITVSVVFGFKHTIRDKVVGFGSHIQIENLLSQQTPTPAPIAIGDSLTRVLKSVDGVTLVQKFAMTQGILKTDKDFLGVLIKGVDSTYNTHFLDANTKAGRLPEFGKTEGQQQIMISQMMADKLMLNVGDRVWAYFIANDDVRVRRFTVTGIYETNMAQFDQTLCFTDIRLPIKINGWEADQCSGAELLVSDFDRIADIDAQVVSHIGRTSDMYGAVYTSKTIYEAYPQVFSWLSLLDINVWIIMVLMVCVAGFTMISGLLIIILERTQMIGILKALGMQNMAVRRTFLWFATFIIGRGLILGNVIGIGAVLLQMRFGIVRLDPASYYVETAPMELSIPIIVALNIATLLISVAVLVLPSMLISHIHPARSMKYE